MKETISIAMSSNFEHYSEVEDFSEGKFYWSKKENKLTLSEALQFELDEDFGTFEESLPDDLFLLYPSSKPENLFKKEFSFLNKLNSETVISFRGKILEDGNSIKGFVFIIRNKTALDHISSVYRNFSLKALSSGFSHEINNPLAIISSVADWMSIRLDKSDVDVANFKERLLIVKKSIIRIQGLISGIERSVMDFKFTSDELNMNTAVEKIFKVFSRRISSQQIKVKIDIDKSISVAGNPALISQIVFNIFSNLLELSSSKDGKKITIVSKVEEKTVEIFFSTGCCIDEKKLLFLQDTNAKIIDLMLHSSNGGFKIDFSAGAVDFIIKLNKI